MLKVKEYILLALTALLGVVSALFYREKAKGAKREKAARKTQEKATDALTEGLKREQEKVNAAKSRTRRRTHFE